MSADAKRSYGSTIALLVLGILALYASGRWLMLLVPAALAVCYLARPAFRRSGHGPGIG